MAKAGEPRGLRDEMNVGPDPRGAHHLVPLSELGKFKVADGEPDIRGWAAYTSTGREIGRVAELLVDPEANEVVMLDIDLRRDDRHTLAPIRAAWVDQATKRVVVDVAAVTTGDEIPALTRRAALSDAEVNEFDERYRQAYAGKLPEGEYHVRHGEEELRFGRREADRATPTPPDATAVRAAPPPLADVADSAAAGREEERREEERREEERRDAERRDAERRERYVERRAADADSWSRREGAGSSASTGSTERTVRYPKLPDERVIERRPIVEEVVIRRREADAAGQEPPRDAPSGDSLLAPRPEDAAGPPE